MSTPNQPESPASSSPAATDRADRDARGYRPDAAGRGARLRADVIDVTIARPTRSPASAEVGDRFEVLQLQRTRDPLKGTWQPVMGHIDGQESATAAAMREAREEVGLNIADPAACAAFWALEQVHPYFISAIDCVVLSPRFLALVAPDWTPSLNHEHAAHRWVLLRDASRSSTWPGQRASLAEVATLLAGDSIEGPWLRIDPAKITIA